MPEISRFRGIVIAMYFREHEAAHFHALQAGFAMSVSLSDGAWSGRFPPAARRRVLSWYRQRREALWQNWLRLRAGRPALPISPPEK
jgi:phosphomannomutase